LSASHRNKLDNLLNDIILRHDHNNSPLNLHRPKEVKKIIPDTTNIRRRLAKLEMNRLVMPFRFRKPVIKRHEHVKEAPLE
jgi:hypothetical protein